MSVLQWLLIGAGFGLLVIGIEWLDSWLISDDMKGDQDAD